MKDLMLTFGVNIAKRFNNRQKRIFYSYTIPFFEDLGYPVAFQAGANKVSPVANIIIGDLDRAATWVAAPYDTPSKSLLPFRYYPFNRKKNLTQENLNIFLHLFIYLLFCIVVWYFAGRFGSFDRLQQGLGIALLVVLFLLSTKLISGFANRVNFNKNSASLALLASLARRTKGRSDVAYILLDKSVSSFEGLNTLANSGHRPPRVFLYLDCLAEGERLALAHGPQAAGTAAALANQLENLQPIQRAFDQERLQDTYLEAFPGMVALCVGQVENQLFVVRGTRSSQDYKVNIPRLESLRDGILSFLGGQNS